MQPNSWQELEKLFLEEMSGEWLLQYPKKEFIAQMVKRTFYYYTQRAPEKKPGNKLEWKRALEFFMREDWLKLGTFSKEASGKVKFKLAYKPHTPPEPVKEKCEFCFDLRTVRAIATDNTHETLMRCPCTKENHDDADWSLPTWTHEWAPLYSKEPCPVEWFKPVIMDGKVDMSIQARARYWREKVRIAEEFWLNEKKAVLGLDDEELIGALDNETADCPF